jgi:hypothetical protein
VWMVCMYYFYDTNIKLQMNIIKYRYNFEEIDGPAVIANGMRSRKSVIGRVFSS